MRQARKENNNPPSSQRPLAKQHFQKHYNYRPLPLENPDLFNETKRHQQRVNEIKRMSHQEVHQCIMYNIPLIYYRRMIMKSDQNFSQLLHLLILLVELAVQPPLLSELIAPILQIIHLVTTSSLQVLCI